MAVAIPRVLVLQTVLPHYRVPLFRRLSLSETAEFIVAYGEARPRESRQTVKDARGVRSIEITNRYLLRIPGRGWLRWQSGILGPVWARRFDVVVLQGDVHCLSSLLASVVCRLRRIGLILWWHGVGQRSSSCLKPVRLLWARMADAILFYDTERPEWFIRRGVPSEKVFIAWNSIDTDLVAGLAADWSAVPRYRVLYIGRLTARKKVGLLVRGFADAAAELPPDARLTVIGDGPEGPMLRRLAADLGIADRTEFTGSITEESRLAPYFNTSLVSISPGAAGLALIHSMAYGVPVLVADDELHGPEFSALTPNVNGMLFPSDDCKALATALVKTFTNRDSIADMGEAARLTVATRYSLSAMVDGFEAAVAYVCRAPNH